MSAAYSEQYGFIELPDSFDEDRTRSYNGSSPEAIARYRQEAEEIVRAIPRRWIPMAELVAARKR